MTNGSHGSTAGPRDPQPGPQAAAHPSPCSAHQHSSPKPELSISHARTSSKSHQCLPVATVLTAAMRWDGSSHARLPSGQGGKGGRYLGQFTGLTPPAHVAAVRTVPSCPMRKGCCTAQAHDACTAGLLSPRSNISHDLNTPSHPPPPPTPGAFPKSSGKNPPCQPMHPECSPQGCWGARDPPGSH